MAEKWIESGEGRVRECHVLKLSGTFGRNYDLRRITVSTTQTVSKEGNRKELVTHNFFRCALRVERLGRYKLR